MPIQKISVRLKQRVLRIAQYDNWYGAGTIKSLHDDCADEIVDDPDSTELIKVTGANIRLFPVKSTY